MPNFHTFRNPAYDGTEEGSLFSHYEIARVIVDHKGQCEPSDDEPQEGEEVIWTIYGRYDPNLMEGFGGVEALMDFTTQDDAWDRLRDMIGSLAKLGA